MLNSSKLFKLVESNSSAEQKYKGYLQSFDLVVFEYEFNYEDTNLKGLACEIRNEITYEPATYKKITYQAEEIVNELKEKCGIVFPQTLSLKTKNGLIYYFYYEAWKMRRIENNKTYKKTNNQLIDFKFKNNIINTIQKVDNKKVKVVDGFDKTGKIQIAKLSTEILNFFFANNVA